MTVLGWVVAFDGPRGIGRIRTRTGDQYFVHRSALGRRLELHPGQAVEFTAVSAPRGPRAEAVKLVEWGDPVSAPESGPPWRLRCAYCGCWFASLDPAAAECAHCRLVAEERGM